MRAGLFMGWALIWGVGPLVAAAAAPEPIQVTGSATVYPFSVQVARHFARSGPFAAPVVQATNTSDGFSRLCGRPSSQPPDVIGASRRISMPERAACIANGGRPVELRIGYDSLVLASHAGGAPLALSLEQLRNAAARFVWRQGAWVRNPYRSWRDISASLPDVPIQLYGPASGHGTRDSFVELVMEPGCAARTASAATVTHSDCIALRDDGRWTDVEDLELVLGKLVANPSALGIVTYSYLEQFSDRIQAAPIEGVVPSRASIPTGQYPIARPLFIYMREDHVREKPELAAFVAEFVSLCAAGANGYLSDEGLVPMPVVELLRQRSVAARLQR